jgi:hypothetical protein
MPISKLPFSASWRNLTPPPDDVDGRPLRRPTSSTTTVHDAVPSLDLVNLVPQLAQPMSGTDAGGDATQDRGRP